MGGTGEGRFDEVTILDVNHFNDRVLVINAVLVPC